MDAKRRVRSFMTVAVVMLASGGIVSTPAKAAYGGIRYVSRSAKLGAQKRGSVRAPCPKGTHVVGGGVTIAGANTFNTVAESIPYDGKDTDRKPDDGWLGTMNNGTPDERRITTWAVCAASGRFYYAKSSVQISKGTTGMTQTQSCPTLTTLVGGGASLTETDQLSALSSSRAFSAQTWTVVAFTGSSSGATLTVHAICAASGAYQHDSYSALKTNTNGAAQETQVLCQDGWGPVMSGGASTSVGSIHSLVPTDSDDADEAPDDGWTAKYNIPATATANTATYEICLAI